MSEHYALLSGGSGPWLDREANKLVLHQPSQVIGDSVDDLRVYVQLLSELLDGWNIVAKPKEETE